jgi:cysteine synthase A
MTHPTRPSGASALDAIGDTPLVRLRKVVPPGAAEVWVKLEGCNPTGSYKDRMARALIEGAEARGLGPGMTVVEYTGGSTGSSLAFVCAVKGYGFRAVSSDAFAPEKLRTMRAFGAEIVIVPSDAGLITPDLIPRMMERTRAFGEEPGNYLTDQMSNRDALDGYRPLGEEILEQLDDAPTAFCAGVGTGGLLMGVASAFRRSPHHVRIVALEPASSPVLTTGRAGTHHVEGIGVGFVPPLFDSTQCDDVRAIDESAARSMARRLAAEEGVFAGISSGLNVVGALQIAGGLGPGHRVVTVACDSGLKYLAGDLYEGSGAILTDGSPAGISAL